MRCGQHTHPNINWALVHRAPTAAMISDSLNSCEFAAQSFTEKFNGDTSSCFHIHSGVPLGPLLYVLYTSDIPTSRETTLGTLSN